MTNETLLKLKQAFLSDCTDKEACYISGIYPSALYRHYEKHPKFKELVHIWKQSPTFHAREKVVRAIKSNDKDTSDAWKWLEKKRRGEFGNVQTIEHTGNIEISEAMDRSKLAKAIEAVEPKMLPENTE